MARSSAHRTPVPVSVLTALLVLAVLLWGLSPGQTDRSSAAAGDPVVAVSGDIGVSDPTDAATATLVERIAPDLVLTTGDNAYPDGTQLDFEQNYDPDWGRFKAITRPSPGNHDYHLEAGNPPYYYTYFADQLPAENGGQFYAVDLGSWRLYSLNCEIDCSATSAQVAWLRDDLATNGVGKNKLAYLHRPRYSCSDRHGSSSRPSALWDELLAARADVVLAAHDHNYQRFPRMTRSWVPSPDGLASFVVGTGGNGLYPVGGIDPACEHLAYGQGTAHGVLKLTLGAADYSWEFVATDDAVLDSGTAATLGAGTPPTEPPTPVVDVGLTSSTDDAEERSSGSVALTSSDLELTTDKSRVQTVGIRFPGVGIPPGASVTAAHVQFQTDEVSTGPSSLTVRGLAADDPPTFTSGTGDVSTRPRTDAAVSWSPPEWPTVGARGDDQRTPDLSLVVQEVVDRPGWASGNAVGFVVTGSGRRAAEAADGAAGTVLHVEYTTGPVTNRAPVVDAGPDQSVLPGSDAQLDGTVSDDGLPTPPTLTTTWSEVGSNGVTFAEPFAVDTTASFPGPGDYTLRLVADDSELTTSDTVVVTVLPPGTSQSVAVPVSASSDDAEERVGRSTSLTSSDLEMVLDKGREQVVGLRFAGVAVPRGAAVTSAYVQFQVDEVTTGPATLTVSGQAADDPPTFSGSRGDVTDRPPTSASAQWLPPDWGSKGDAGPDQRTSELSAVVQEIVDRPGWASGNALVLVISGSGNRTAESSDGSAAPVLHVEYQG